VLGCNTASSGATSGVNGEVDSPNNSAAGVRGVAKNNSSDAAADGVVGKTSGTGVVGQNLNPDQLAIGVRGEATNSSAVRSYGVYGSNSSDQSGTAGVFGGSFGNAGKTYGILGQTTSGDTGAAGVSGEATSSSGTVYGVSGKTMADTTDAAGVYGEAIKTAGCELLGSNTGGGYALGTDGDAEIDGALDVTKVGLSAWRRNNQPIPDDTDTTVVYDVVKEDHFDSYDESTGVYTVPVAGDYHVDFVVDWFGSFSTGDNVRYELLIDRRDTFGINVFTQVPEGISTPERSFSKTLFGLSKGDTIEVQVNQKSGSSVDIYGNGSATTYLTIHKVG
jgi:hypothetical protein